MINKTDEPSMTNMSINDEDAEIAKQSKIKAESQTMMSMAQSAGITLQEYHGEPGQFRGICPFHEPKMQTFAVNVLKGRFHCIYCRRAGGAITLAAQLWKVSTSDAAEILQATTGPIPGQRPKPAEPPSNPNSAVVNRLMVYFNHDLAINRHAANICTRLGLDSSKLANQGMGWCWPGRPMDELLNQRLTPEELTTSDLMAINEEGSWVTTVPGGFVIPDLDHNKIASRLIAYDAAEEQWHFPSNQPPAIIGLRRLFHHEEVIHLTDQPLVYLKAVEIGTPTALICDHQQLERAARAVNNKAPSSLAIYSEESELLRNTVGLAEIPEAEPTEALSRFNHMTPRRTWNLRSRPRRQTETGRK